MVKLWYEIMEDVERIDSYILNFSCSKEEGHRNGKLACSKPAQGDCFSLGTND